MVDGHSLGDLTLKPGDPVVGYGVISRDDESDRLLLWVADAWRPEQHRRHADGFVEVTAVAGAELPEGTTVEVRGIWAGSGIADASAVSTESPVVTRWQSLTSDLEPGELGLARFERLGEMIRSANGGSTLGSGGTDDALWFHVLYVTPALAELEDQLPTRVDIFASIVHADVVAVSE